MQYSVFDIKNKDGKIIERLNLSKLCFGSLCMGPLQSMLSVEDGAKVILRAFEQGVNFIDTAQLYKTYSYIRRAFELLAEKNGDKNAANKIVVSTKSYAYTMQGAKDALDEALSELGREYIDIFMLHEQESIHTLNGHIDALEYLFEMKEKNKIKSVGISTHRISGVLGAVEWNKSRKPGQGKLDIVNSIYNIKALGICDGSAVPEIRLAEMESALKIAREEDIFVLAMKVLGGGNFFATASESLDFVLDKPFVDSIALGMKSVLEVDANILYFNERKFSGEYYDNKGGIGEKRLHIEDWCTGCGECVKICPANALTVNKYAICDTKKCVLCGYCSSVCKDFSIKII